MEQELMEQEQKVFTGQILGFGYNQISIKRDDNSRKELLFIDGLQKRVLSGVDENLLKRLKRLEWVGEDWDIGINPIVCCDVCNNELFSLFGDSDFIDYQKCGDCEKWLCDNCINEKGLCSKCNKKEILRSL